MTLQPTPLGRLRTAGDGCRRYRVAAVAFDTRVRVLEIEVRDEWEPHIKEMWLSNKRHLREALLFEFGIDDSERKLNDFIALDAGPWSVVALHNRIIRAVRTAFVAGAYYPALVGAAALGERILNQVVLELRGEFLSEPATKLVMKKQSFDDWRVLIRVLHEWHVLDDEVARDFKRLHKLRNDAVHYNVPSLDRASRAEALDAVTTIQRIIEKLFHPEGDRVIPNATGVTFLRRDVEADPFVRRFFIPASALVSPIHEWASHDPITVLDDPNYVPPGGDDALSDEAFVSLYAAQRPQ